MTFLTLTRRALLAATAASALALSARSLNPNRSIPPPSPPSTISAS